MCRILLVAGVIHGLRGASWVEGSVVWDVLVDSCGGSSLRVNIYYLLDIRSCVIDCSYPPVSYNAQRGWHTPKLWLTVSLFVL
jgi:hypothetical protein